MGKYFGTDGVRGEANVELTPELAFKLGRFGGYVLSQHESEVPRVFVGRDTRISGEMLESALVAGLLSVGIHVYKLVSNSLVVTVINWMMSVNWKSKLCWTQQKIPCHVQVPKV